MSDSPSEISVLIIATSLNPDSHSYLLAREACAQLQKQGRDVSLQDLRDLPIPLYPGDGSEPETVVALREKVGHASHILFAVPVYNWDVNSAAKNVVEWLSTHELGGKTVGFLCAAGGQSSYTAVMPFANSLMLDFRCWIVPRFVFAVGSDFSEDAVTNPKVIERIERLAEEMFR